MVGSDVVGSLRNYVSTIRAYDELFGGLGDEEVVARVASGNLIRLMPEKGIILPAEYLYSAPDLASRRPNLSATESQ